MIAWQYSSFSYVYELGSIRGLEGWCIFDLDGFVRISVGIFEQVKEQFDFFLDPSASTKA